MSDTLRAAVIGWGPRARSLVDTFLSIREMKLTAICDLDKEFLGQAEKLLNDHGVYPKTYTDYHQLIRDREIDLAFVTTNWITHIPVVCDFLTAGIPVASEVCGAATVEECWDLVRTWEATGTPLMFLENCCYGRDEMMALNLARSGKLGIVEYMEGAYCHDIRYALMNPKRHRVMANMYRHGDLYPTHSIGIQSKILNVNAGNRLVSIASMACPANALAGYFDEKDPGNPNAGRQFACEDMTDSLIKCANGELILLKHSTLLPRPYSRGLLVQGTKGIVSEERHGIWLEGISEEEKWESFEDVYEKYDHPVWKQYQVPENDVHGGMDYLVIHEFVSRVIDGDPMPIDVYDMATWMCLTALSGQSIDLGGAVQPIPDFTRGKWAERKPVELRG